MSLDNILLIPGLGGRSLVAVPDGFEYTPPFNIYKRSNVLFETDINIESYMVTPSVEYYLSPTGDDSNDGLSAGSPKKSISALVTALNAAPPTGATLYLEPGQYIGADSINGSNFTFPCNVICQNGVAELSARTIPTWSKTAGRTNIWQTTNSFLPAITDSTNIDLFNLAIRLDLIAGGDLNAIDATPNSCGFAANRVYVHLHDSREPDSNVTLYGTALNGLTQTSAVNLFFQGISFRGWNICSRIDVGSALTACFNLCEFLYSRNGNNFYFDVVGGQVVLNNCKAAYGFNDGFNYELGDVAEINCLSAWNGYSTASTSDNGSTTHNTVRSVRIGGQYIYNDDRNHHDITSTQNWLLGCKAGFAQNGSTNKYANANFIFGREGQSDATLGWLDGCTSLGGSASDLGSYGNAIVRIRNGIGFTITDGDGTIEAY